MTEEVKIAHEPHDVMHAMVHINSLAREIFTHIANKWALLIVNALGDGTLRFTHLHTAVQGISHKMLAQTLRTLERDGVVDRRVYATVPPRVEYSLTEAGRGLRDTVNEMCTWTRQHARHIEAARRHFDGQ
ncbi:HxlR family transcriptional regulator [Streptomyces sp. 150FB]|nr:HxlR family transcriptional regulator [Streptomyces sp. 150FB]